MALPIRVYGTTLRGRDFTEDCVCVKISRHGAQIRLRHELIVDEPIRIVNLKNNKEATFRVVGQVSRPADAPYADWGVEGVDMEEEMWAS